MVSMFDYHKKRSVSSQQTNDIDKKSKIRSLLQAMTRERRGPSMLCLGWFDPEHEMLYDMKCFMSVENTNQYKDQHCVNVLHVFFYVKLLGFRGSVGSEVYTFRRCLSGVEGLFDTFWCFNPISSKCTQIHPADPNYPILPYEKINS